VSQDVPPHGCFSFSYSYSYSSSYSCYYSSSPRSYFSSEPLPNCSSGRTDRVVGSRLAFTVVIESVKGIAAAVNSIKSRAELVLSTIHFGAL
jgi:hypothetical protein